MMVLSKEKQQKNKRKAPKGEKGEHYGIFKDDKNRDTRDC